MALIINSVSQPSVSQSSYEHVHIIRAVFTAYDQSQTWTTPMVYCQQSKEQTVIYTMRLVSRTRKTAVAITCVKFLERNKEYIRLYKFIYIYIRQGWALFWGDSQKPNGHVFEPISKFVWRSGHRFSKVHMWSLHWKANRKWNVDHLLGDLQCITLAHTYQMLCCERDVLEVSMPSLREVRVKTLVRPSNSRYSNLTLVNDS